MTEPGEPKPAKRPPIAAAEWVKIGITVAVLLLTYAGLSANGVAMGRRETFWFVLFTALPFLAVAAILYCAIRDRQDRLRKTPPRLPMTEDTRALVIETVERVLREEISQQELSAVVFKLESYKTGELLDWLLHEAMHFVSDADIRAGDKEYDAVQRKALAETLRKFIAQSSG